MITNIQYNELLGYAEKYAVHLSNYDLVHDAIIETDCIDEIKKIIRNTYNQEKRRQMSFGIKDNKQLNNHKFCKKCNQDKPLDFFSKRVDKKTGFQYRWYCCRDCQNDMQKKWRDSGKQKEINKRRNDKYNNDLEWKAHVKLTRKIWEIRNPEKIKAINKIKNDKKRLKKQGVV